MEESYDGTWLCFTSVRCANDTVRSATSDYHRICDAVATRPNQLVLDTYYYTTDTLNQLNGDFNILQWVSMLFVLLVLILLSWLIVLGLMALFDMHFNLVNIIISTFIFGIGVDYSIFVMSGLVDGNKRPGLLEYHKTAIFFSAVILIVTVGSMLFAVHPAIRSVGFSTLTGLVAAVVLSYVMQPPLCTGGWRNGKRPSKKGNGSDEIRRDSHRSRIGRTGVRLPLVAGGAQRAGAGERAPDRRLPAELPPSRTGL